MIPLMRSAGYGNRLCREGIPFIRGLSSTKQRKAVQTIYCISFI